ncbi:hypothetical protein [Nocardia abscessus]|uniref:hypothetical protein n=1 Tax=Nocardia abscessus TaxID=120957 RepID=UPI002453B9A2|nr:hypothetical protein [Nocardia abscessus]
MEFAVTGVPILHYRAEEGAAEAFASAVRRQRLARSVTVDDEVTQEMNPLPYQRLFEP